MTFQLPISNIIYFLVIMLIMLSSLVMCIYCIIKVVKSSNGFSLLDPDVLSSSFGLQARKWFLISLSLLNATRCASSSVELFIVSQITFNNNMNIENDDFYDKISTFTAYSLFVARMFPICIYLGCYTLLGLFVLYLYFTMSGYNFLMMAIFWIMSNLVALMLIFQYLLISPDLMILNGILMLIFIVYSFGVIMCLYAVQLYYATSSSHNQTPLVSYNQSQSHTLNSSKKVINRFYCLLVLVIASISMHVFVFTFDFANVLKERSFFFRSTLDLLSIWVGECAIPYLAILLLSNSITNLEAILTHRRGGFWGAITSNTNRLSNNLSFIVASSSANNIQQQQQPLLFSSNTSSSSIEQQQHMSLQQLNHKTTNSSNSSSYQSINTAL